MEVDSGNTGKGATVRSALERCRALFEKQRAILYQQFARLPATEGRGKSPSPKQDNVLDEIIDGLLILAKDQDDLIAFTEKNIITKL